MASSLEHNKINEPCNVPMELPTTTGQPAPNTDESTAANLVPSSVVVIDTSYDPGPPPDGGPRAWTQLLVGFLINALTWGCVASFGVYQLYYTETLLLPPSQISWIGSVQVFLIFFISTFSGRGADAGYARHLVLVGTVLLLIGTFTTSLAVTYWQIFLAQGICTGIGMGMTFMPAVAVVGTYFARKKTTALAFAASGSGFGSVVFPAMVQYLTPQIGFSRAVRSAAFVALFFAVTINILLRPRLPPRRSGPIVEWAAFREPSYVLFTIGMFLIFWALYFGFFYINTFARKIIGFSDLESINLLLITNAVGIPVRPLLGLLADRHIGPINTLIPSALLLGLMLYLWVAVDSRGGLYVFAVFYGIATAATQGIFVGALASLTKDLSKTGTRFGMVCSILAFATAAGPPIAGALIQQDGGGFLTAQVWGGTVVVLGSGVLGLARIIPDNAPVFHCCKTGNLLGLQKILSERSASVRDTDSQGRTPLHFAAAECYPQMCQFLIQAGADVSIEATWAGTPFMLASFPYASVTTTTEHRPTCDQVDTLRVIANGGQDILEAIEDGALIYTFSADSQSRSRLVKSGKAQSTSAWLLQQCLLSARDIGHSFEPRWWVRILTEALINEAEQELITEVLQYCDPVMVQFAVCMWIKIMSHRLRVHRSIKASSTNLRQILRKIPDLHFVYEHDFLMNPIALGPLTPTSLALRRSYTFAFFRSLLKEASIDIEEFVRIESDIIGSGWQENTLRATFLDDYPMVELGDRELAYCKHCECHMDVMGWHETLWEQRLERRKEMKDPNGPFSEKELRQQNEWRRYVHEFVENHICYKCQERTRVQNDTEHEDGFSPYLLHL
ncbi:hypothetical protein MMC17_004744 [Xylographa soralifera]|nr:hypothetical protein [Xylographa soralifera]